jgi:hypothetical protein
MTRTRILVSLGLLGFLAGCETTVPRISAPLPARIATYSCSQGVTLAVRRAGASVAVSDSRDIEVTLPASPPGQSVRYAEGIHALILEDGEATWFVSGQVPVECRR